MMGSAKKSRKIMIDNGGMCMSRKASLDLDYLMFLLLADGRGAQLGSLPEVSMIRLKRRIEGRRLSSWSQDPNRLTKVCYLVKRLPNSSQVHRSLQSQSRLQMKVDSVL